MNCWRRFKRNKLLILDASTMTISRTTPTALWSVIPCAAQTMNSNRCKLECDVETIGYLLNATMRSADVVLIDVYFSFSRTFSHFFPINDRVFVFPSISIFLRATQQTRSEYRTNLVDLLCLQSDRVHFGKRIAQSNSISMWNDFDLITFAWSKQVGSAMVLRSEINSVDQIRYRRCLLSPDWIL